MGRIPSELSALLKQFSIDLPRILGKNLVGIYLYGSLTQRAFHPRKSDVDCIVVTRRDLSETQFTRLAAWLTHASQSNPWMRKFEISFLIKDQLLTMNSRACLYQFGLLKRSGSDGNPIIWINVLESGVVLHGPSPGTFVPEITSEMFFEALKREVGYLREEIITKPNSEWRDVPFYRAYAVLTLCRILYSFEKQTIVSKPRAARWTRKHFPGNWDEIIHQALLNDDQTRCRIPLRRLKRFIDFVDGYIRS